MVLAGWTQTGISATEFTVNEVVDGIYVHEGVHEEMTVENRGDIVNSVFIVGRDAVAVIDPGGSVHNAKLLREAISERTSLPVQYVVLTHFHPDHVAGSAVFADTAQIVAHANYPRAVAQRGDFYIDRFAELFDTDSTQRLQMPNTLVVDELQVDLGERTLRIEAHATAHTDNDVTVVDLATNTLIAGDLVFSQRLPSLDGSLVAWLRVLESLAGKHFQLVIPGHGRPASWARATSAQVHYLGALRDQVRTWIERGDTLSTAIEASLNDVNSAGWELFEQVHPTNVTKAYTELEWE